jgi:hypothetical protein
MKVLVERIEPEYQEKFLAMMWRTLPNEYEIINLNGKDYYLFEGAFYIKSTNGYRFTSAPLGAVVHHLPDYSEIIQTDSKTYFHYCGNYYEYQPKNHSYMIVEKPLELDPPDNESRVTIDLLDGQKFQGDILDVTSDSIYFQSNEGLLELSISEVSSMTFISIPLEERRN